MTLSNHHHLDGFDTRQRRVEFLHCGARHARRIFVRVANRAVNIFLGHRRRVPHLVRLLVIGRRFTIVNAEDALSDPRRERDAFEKILLRPLLFRVVLVVRTTRRVNSVGGGDAKTSLARALVHASIRNPGRRRRRNGFAAYAPPVCPLKPTALRFGLEFLTKPPLLTRFRRARLVRVRVRVTVDGRSRSLVVFARLCRRIKTLPDFAQPVAEPGQPVALVALALPRARRRRRVDVVTIIIRRFRTSVRALDAFERPLASPRAFHASRHARQFLSQLLRGERRRRRALIRVARRARTTASITRARVRIASSTGRRRRRHDASRTRITASHRAVPSSSARRRRTGVTRAVVRRTNASRERVARTRERSGDARDSARRALATVRRKVKMFKFSPPKSLVSTEGGRGDVATENGRGRCGRERCATRAKG